MSRRVHITTTLLPQVHEELVRRAIARHGRANRVNRIIEGFMSLPFEPTTEQKRDPVLAACWHDRLTEQETIERCCVEIANLRGYAARSPDEQDGAVALAYKLGYGCASDAEAANAAAFADDIVYSLESQRPGSRAFLAGAASFLRAIADAIEKIREERGAR